MAAVAPIELKESPGTKIPDAPSGGIVSSLATTSAATIGSVEVSVDISHTWIGDLRVSVRSPSGTEAILHDGAGGSADNVVRTFTPTNAPPLAALAGQPAGGTWQLNVVDRAAQDVGKLNAWKVLIKPLSPAATSFRGPGEGRVVLHDEPALHHETHALHLADVGERIAGDRNQIGVLALSRRCRSASPSRSSAWPPSAGTPSAAPRAVVMPHFTK